MDSGPTATVRALHLVLHVCLYRLRCQTFSRTDLVTDSPLPATQSDILEILRQVQGHAVALLSLGPLLSSLFLSHAGRAVALESASATLSPGGEKWKALQDSVPALQGEREKLESENPKVLGKLEAAAASQEAFRSPVSSLKGVDTTQQDDLRLLRAELVEAKDKYDQLIVGLNADRSTLQIQIQILDLQVNTRIRSPIECAHAMHHVSRHDAKS